MRGWLDGLVERGELERDHDGLYRPAAHDDGWRAVAEIAAIANTYTVAA